MEWRAAMDVNRDRAAFHEYDARACILILSFLRDMCEGHNLEMQNFVREQTTHQKSFNLVVRGASEASAEASATSHGARARRRAPPRQLR